MVSRIMNKKRLAFRLLGVTIAAIVIFNVSQRCYFFSTTQEYNGKDQQPINLKLNGTPLYSAGLLTEQKPHNFEGFDNETGLQTGDFLVPKIVHFMRFGAAKAEIEFVDFVVILAAFRNQRPQRLLFHTDSRNFTGRYWEQLLAAPGFASVAELVRTELPERVFGQPFEPRYRMWHAADVTRIRILMEYGGIILDNDSYVVRSLDRFRRFELAIGWDKKYIGIQVIVAHRDARFLPLYLDTYRQYNGSLWYYNGGERPSVEVLYRRPELVHRVRLLFGVHSLAHRLYRGWVIWPGWRRQFAVHLLIRWHEDKRFDEDNFLWPPTTFSDMVLDVYDPVARLPRAERRTQQPQSQLRIIA